MAVGRYRVWASTCPLVARSTMIGIGGSWLLSWVLPNLDIALRNDIDDTVKQFEGTEFCNYIFFNIRKMRSLGLLLFKSGEQRQTAAVLQHI